MNINNISGLMLQKILSTIALFALVFSPLSGVYFASSDTGGPGSITSAVYDEAENELSVSGTYKDAPLGDKKTPGFAVFVDGDTPEDNNKSLDDPITLLPHTESGIWSNTYKLNKAPTSVCVVVYDVDPTKSSDDDGKHSLVPDGSKRNTDNSYDESKWGDGSWLDGTCVTPEVIQDTVTICHATNSDGNPYNVQTPAKNSDVSGHDGHNGPIWFEGIETSWGDIIPPFDYDGGSYLGKNWEEGEEIWNNDCEIPEDDEEEVLGCTDEEATNYNPKATEGNEDAEDCEYPEIPVEDLKLTSMCIYEDGGAQWRVRNENNDFDVDFTWEIYSNQETGGPITATYGPAFGSGDTFFDSTLTGTMKIYWMDENNEEQSTTKASNKTLCEPEPEEFTVVAHKIVCELESEIPNKDDWGSLAPIGASTAQDWVDSHDSCEFAEDWDFEWVLHSDTTDPGDTLVGPAGGDWTTFGSTDVNGMTSVNISEDELGDETQIWLREVLKSDYLTFSHEANPDNSDDYTAAFFCNDDVLNYDNREWIKDIEMEETYYCVAWNYLEPVYGCTDPEALNYDPEATHDDQSCEYEEPVCEIGENLLVNGSFEEEEVENKSLWERILFVTGWDVEEVHEDSVTTLEHHRGWKGNVAAHADQYVELDGDEPSRISQDVVTEEGAKYELSWAFAPRQDTIAEENELSVEVDGSEVATEGPLAGIGVLSQSDWILGSYEFTASSDLTEIAFKDLGPKAGNGDPDVGTFLDDAVLCLVEEAPECEPERYVFADNAVDSDQGPTKGGGSVADNRSNPEDATGDPDWSPGGSDGFFSLGLGGWIEVSFDKFVVDVEGDDISIHEATNGNYPIETAKVEVSQDGSTWYELSEEARNDSSEGGDGVTLLDFSETGLSWIKYVRVTDTTDEGLHSNGADGFDLDTVDAAYVVCDEPEPKEEVCELVIVSDDTATVSEKGGAFAKLLSFIHPQWTAVIDGASWIWGDDPVVDSTIDETQTFVNEFEWYGGVDSATLYIASDNSHEAEINNVTAGVETDEQSFRITDQDEYDVTGLISQGDNTLEVAVKNWAGNANPQNNPAGAMYKLVVKNDDPDCRPEGGSITILKDANGEGGDSTEFDFDGDLDDFSVLGDNTDSEVFSDLEDGEYEIFELVEAGWVFDGVSCTGADESDWYTSGETGVVVELDDGEDVTCTFYNDKEKTYYIDGYKWNDADGNGEWFEEDTLSGWTIEITNGEDTFATTTDENGYYWFEVPAGIWTVSEVQQGGWTQTAPEGGVCEFEVYDYLVTQSSIWDYLIPTAHAVYQNEYRCDFGNQEDRNGGGGDDPFCSLTASKNPVSSGEEFDLIWNTSDVDFVEIDQGIGSVELDGSTTTSITDPTLFTLTGYFDDEDSIECTVDVDIRSGGGGGGGGGGGLSPQCDAFDLDGDTLSWETDNGFDLLIELNGSEIYSETDNDIVEEGTFELSESPLAGDVFLLTVIRGSKDDTCTIELDGEGEVLGEATEILPLGAPDTGAGGTAPIAPVLPSLLTILGIVEGARRVKNV